jgi:hypothetical protein
MNFLVNANCVRRLPVVVVLVAMTSCGAKDSVDKNLQSDLVPDLSSIETGGEVIGTNCRAETIVGANGATRYKSEYFSILANGGEEPLNMAETETPCP